MSLSQQQYAQYGAYFVLIILVGAAQYLHLTDGQQILVPVILLVSGHFFGAIPGTAALNTNTVAMNANTSAIVTATAPVVPGNVVSVPPVASSNVSGQTWVNAGSNDTARG